MRQTTLVTLKLIEEQPQILRLTTPELKDVRGPFAQNDSQFGITYLSFVLSRSGPGH